MGTIISAEDLDKLDDIEPVTESFNSKEKRLKEQSEEKSDFLNKNEDSLSVVREAEKQAPSKIATEDEVQKLQTDNQIQAQTQEPNRPVISAEALDSMEGESINFEQFDENNVINKSPLGFFERSAVSYATEKRKKNYLENRFGKNNIKETKDENKYFIRNSDGKWYREDPTIGASFRFSEDAMKELAADALADIQPELIRLAGQGAGAVAGAGVGAPIALPTLGQSITTGAIGGSAIGRGLGQGIVELVGKINGMRPETTLQDAFVEMGRQSSYGATSEILGPYISKGLQKAVSLPGKALASGMSSIGSKLHSAINKNSAFADFLDSFWGGISGIPKDAAKRMRELGRKVINNPRYRDIENVVEPLLINGTKALENYEQEASKQYAQTVKSAMKEKIWVMDVYSALRGALQGKINPLTGTRTSNVASPSEGRDLEKLAEYFTGMLKIKGIRYDKTVAGKVRTIRDGKMTLGQLKSMITDIDDRISQWSSEGAGYMARVGRQVRYALTKVLHQNKDYLNADKEFEGVQFFLKSLNVIDKNMSGIDKFLKNYSSLPEWLKARLWKLEKSLPKDKQFLEEGLTMAAANVWNELGKLNFASLAQLGLGRYFGGNLGLGIAFLVRNPKLLQKFVFGGFEQAPNFVKSMATGAGSMAGRAGKTGAFLGTEKIGRTLEETITKPMGIAEASELKSKMESDEGFSGKVYKDTRDNPTIGFGFNLNAPHVRKLIPNEVLDGKRELTRLEALDIEEKLLKVAKKDVETYLGKGSGGVPQEAKTILEKMAYNMGLPVLNGFKKLRSAVLRGDWESASNEILDSDYGRSETSGRAKKYAEEMRQIVSPESKKKSISDSEEIWEEIPTESGEKLELAIKDDATNDSILDGAKKIVSEVPIVQALNFAIDSDERVSKAIVASLHGEDTLEAFKNPENVKSFQSRFLDKFYSNPTIKNITEDQRNTIEKAITVLVGGGTVSAFGLALDIATHPLSYIPISGPSARVLKNQKGSLSLTGSFDEPMRAIAESKLDKVISDYGGTKLSHVADEASTLKGMINSGDPEAIPTAREFLLHNPMLVAEKQGATLQTIDKIKLSPVNIDYWNRVYKSADPISYQKLMAMGGEGSKVENVAKIYLTKNCERYRFVNQGKQIGIIPKEFPDVDCYGLCYTNARTASSDNARVAGYIPREKRNIGLTTKEDIDKFFKSKANIRKLNESVEIRHGQDGDDSHSIATGLAEHWLKRSREAGVKKPNVFISASYAPTDDASYKALLPYKDDFVIHFTESGWFSKGEILNRFNEFQKAKNAGLNVGMRIITNDSGVKMGLTKASRETAKPVLMENESFLMDLVNKHIPEAERKNTILETPLHNDFVPSRSKTEIKCSKPSIKGASVCCVTGACKTCGNQCLTKNLLNPLKKGK